MDRTNKSFMSFKHQNIFPLLLLYLYDSSHNVFFGRNCIAYVISMTEQNAHIKTLFSELDFALTSGDANILMLVLVPQETTSSPQRSTCHRTTR